MLKMSRIQLNPPKSGTISTFSTCMLAMFESEAFSRAIWIADLGMSTESSVRAQPLELNVPEVSVWRWNERLEQPLAAPATTRSRAHAQRGSWDMRQTIALRLPWRKLRTGAPVGMLCPR